MNSYEWEEDLNLANETCPPESAMPINGFYFRLGNNPPTPEDFFSHRRLNPDQSYSVTECRARSVSLFDTEEAAKKIKKMPKMRDKNLTVLEINFVNADGLVMQTGDNKHHFSWWKDKGFDISKCKAK